MIARSRPQIRATRDPGMIPCVKNSQKISRKTDGKQTGEAHLHGEGYSEAVYEDLVGERIHERADLRDLLPLAGEVAVEEVRDGLSETRNL